MFVCSAMSLHKLPYSYRKGPKDGFILLVIGDSGCRKGDKKMEGKQMRQSHPFFRLVARTWDSLRIAT